MSNFHVLQTNLARSQPDADRIVRVKREDDDDNDETSNENENEARSKDQCTAQLLVELQTSREAYNKIYSQNQKDKENAEIKQHELQKVIGELKSFNSQLNRQNLQLNADLNVLKTESQKFKSQCSQLGKENIKLKADLKKLEKSTARTASVETDKEFDVEQLLDHKIKNGEQYFLVKWKGYASKYNSWEKRSSLSCPRLLSNYFK